MKIYIAPQVGQWPTSGGVREHLRIIDRFFTLDNDIELVIDPLQADIYHIESAYSLPPGLPKKPRVYVCHGGFVPKPIPQVLRNLHEADVIVSVAKWLPLTHFPNLVGKTVHIPNGIDLQEYDLSTIQPIDPKGYVLYGKDYIYNPAPYVQAIVSMTDLLFMSVTPMPIPMAMPTYNFKATGRVDKTIMNRLIRSAGCLVMTGSEVCPTMVLEAWACETPVVANGIDGNKELMFDVQRNRWRGGRPFDRNSNIVQAIRDTLKHRDILGKEGRKIVEESYNMLKIIELYKKVYKRLL